MSGQTINHMHNYMDRYIIWFKVDSKLCEDEGLLLFNNTCTKLANICMMKDMEENGCNIY